MTKIVKPLLWLAVVLLGNICGILASQFWLTPLLQHYLHPQPSVTNSISLDGGEKS